MDPQRVPILVGCGRITKRITVRQGDTKFPSPLDLLSEAVDAAANDLGLAGAATADVLASVESVGTVNMGPVGIHKLIGGDGVYHNIYPNMPWSLAKHYGAEPKRDLLFSSMASGHQPQLTVNTIAELIGRAEIKIGLCAGCEFLNLLKQLVKLGWKVKPPDAANHATDEFSDKFLPWGDAASSRPVRPGSPVHHKLFNNTHPQELANCLTAPVHVYPMFEQAIRGSRGLSVEEHMKQQSQRWAGFSEIAAEHPTHSWFPIARTAEEIQHPNGTHNRFVCYPYTKYHCSVMDVDQSAAIILMSVAEARRRGIHESKWVYLHGCYEAVDSGASLDRTELHRVPAMEMMGAACCSDANISVDQIDFYDIYSCFPCAVDICVSSLGIKPEIANDPRKLTITGGMAFHGGPGANYAMHSIAAMMEKLRIFPGKFGMVTSNGGYLTKHAAGIYSTLPYSVTHPFASGWSRSDPAKYQAELDAIPCQEIATSPHGAGRVESYIVQHDGQNNPVKAICVGLLQEGDDCGKRFFAINEERDSMLEVMSRDLIGETVHVVPASKLGCPNTFALSAGIPTSRM